MDIKVEPELSDIEKDIKKERELIIESDWLPIKFENEENEYYQEFVQECNQNTLSDTVVKDESNYSHFIIEYLDESDEYDGCNDDDDYAGSDDSSTENDSDEGEDNYLNKLETTEPVCKEESSESKDQYKLGLNRWLTSNYISRECTVCSEKTNYNDWRRHVRINHKESIEEAESNYNFNSNNYGVCKKCNQEFFAKFSRYVHALKHVKKAAKLGILCKICNFSSKLSSVQKHILKKHKEVVEEFQNSDSLESMSCPLCSYSCTKHIHLCYHFADKHPEEYKAKFRYNCHICKHLLFSEEERFLKHIMEKHDLNSWIALNYRKVFEDKEYFACKECNRLFFQNDTCKLLSHFLKHDKNYRWSCKYCLKKFYFKTSPVSHMCGNMLRYYKKHSLEIHKASKKSERRIQNLQEFEKHIAHVCPFCNKEFCKMLKWQHHLRTDHSIDTLEGLEMKVIRNDSSKLSCVICHTVVENSPEQLHAHRFQHLPFKPYKCLYCSKTLNTFIMAVNHDIKRCKDEDILVESIDDPGYDMRSILEMQCSFCNYQKIPDSKNVFKHYEDEHNYFEDFFIRDSNDSMTCKICHKRYVQHEKKAYFLHLHQHFDEKTFKCKLCLRSYSTLGHFSEHFSHFHNSNKSVNKQAIEKNTNNKEDETSNVRELPHLGESSFKSYVLNEYAEFISYACPECNEGMTSQQNWYNHIRSQHTCFDESNLYIRKADGSIECPTCHKSANTSRRTQQTHKLIHMQYKSFICNLCYVRCNSLGVLYKHFRRKHFAHGSFKCPICPEVLSTQHGRTVHLKEIHPRSEWPDSMCLICYQILLKKDQLKAHMVAHDAEENFGCPICYEVFQTAERRIEHLKEKHPRSEWPESMCSICFKILASKRNLNNHMITHDVDRFKYTCEVCGSKLFNIRDFNTHMDRHKTRGEIKEKIDVSQSASQSTALSDATDIETVPKFKVEIKNKRKSLSRSSITKRKKSGGE